MIISRTPYRISFFGAEISDKNSLTDNYGTILSTTIDKFCNISLKKIPIFDDHKYRLIYSKTEVVQNISKIQHPVIKAVINDLSDHLDNSGYEIEYNGDLPAGSGVGSSSAFVVGLINAFANELGIVQDKMQLSNYAVKIQQDVLRQQNGFQDQIAASFGGFNRIDFKENKKYTVNKIKINYNRLKLFHSHLLLFYSGGDNLSTNVFTEIKIKENIEREKLNFIKPKVDKALHILTNNDTDIKELGILFDDLWNYNYSLNSDIYNSKINLLYKVAKQNGALGGKVLGGNKAGFILLFAAPEYHEHIISSLPELVHISFQFENSGSHIVCI